MSQYQQFKIEHQADYDLLNRNYNLISVIRLLLVLTCLAAIFYFIKTSEYYYIIAGIGVFMAFILLVKKHRKIAWHRSLKEQLIAINSDELSYISGESLPFGDGVSFVDKKHLYSYDLDIFGEYSLYQHLNRTATYIGSQSLANLLLSRLSNKEIIENQEAVKELSKKIEWRQDLLALAKVEADTKQDYTELINWSKQEKESISFIANLLSYITPLLFLGAAIGALITHEWLYIHIAEGIFIINLIIAGSQYAKLKNQVIDADAIPKIIRQYGLVLNKIENENFHTHRLQQLQSQITIAKSTSSTQFNKLSSLFSSIQNIQNLMGAVIFNGTSLYHVHILRKVYQWKNDHADNIELWLQTIGNIEALNSLANLSYNNPSFAYPQLNEDYNIHFEGIGHPLISGKTRITNDLSFDQQQFIILTGSNMSGKSTFLRTLGINMILAGTGSCICAKAANIHPLNVVVSMRLADSLAESESYFFAEVKRLKTIIDELASKKCFVLLDEILKGTNSDDKQSGTIEVIKRVVSYKSIGAIATHDLEVCTTTDSFPDDLINKCFEAEIVDNELFFDYKIKDGICQNKSATFLLEKLGVI